MTKEKISELIKKRRKELKIRQDDLSEISGVTLHTISDIESGKGNPTIETLLKLCDTLGLIIKIDVRNVLNET